MSIRSKIREKAEAQLKEVEEQLLDAARDLTMRTSIAAEELCQLAGGHKVDSLRKQVVTRIANQIEERMMDQLSMEDKQPGEGS